MRPGGRQEERQVNGPGINSICERGMSAEGVPQKSRSFGCGMGTWAIRYDGAVSAIESSPMGEKAGGAGANCGFCVGGDWGVFGWPRVYKRVLQLTLVRSMSWVAKGDAMVG